MATLVTIRRADGRGETIAGVARTDDVTEAILRVARRRLGYTRIGLSERFPGGNTRHVQFAVGGTLSGGGISLSHKYVIHTEPA